MQFMMGPDSYIYMENGVLHRLDGPAYVSPEEIMYYFNGKLHSDTGPARIFADGKAEFWTMGEHLHTAILDVEIFNKFWNIK